MKTKQVSLQTFFAAQRWSYSYIIITCYSIWKWKKNRACIKQKAEKHFLHAYFYENVGSQTTYMITKWRKCSKYNKRQCDFVKVGFLLGLVLIVSQTGKMAFFHVER